MAVMRGLGLALVVGLRGRWERVGRDGVLEDRRRRTPEWGGTPSAELQPDARYLGRQRRMRSAELEGSLQSNGTTSAKASISGSKIGGCHYGGEPATLIFEGLPWAAEFTAKGRTRDQGARGVQVEVPAFGLDCTGTASKGLTGSSGSGPVAPAFTKQLVDLVSGKGECRPERTGRQPSRSPPAVKRWKPGPRRPAGPGTGTAEGTVTAGGTPFAGVSVSVCEEEEPVTCYNATTNASGQYSVSGLPEGEYVAPCDAARPRRIFRGRIGRIPDPGGGATTADIALVQDGSLNGTVTRRRRGAGGRRRHRSLRWTFYGCSTAVTEAAGQYSFAEVGEGQYVVTATAPAHSG